MKRYQFRAGCILMGWCPVVTSLELRTSIGTVMELENGDLDETLGGQVIDRAETIFREQCLPLNLPRKYQLS